MLFEVTQAELLQITQSGFYAVYSYEYWVWSQTQVIME